MMKGFVGGFSIEFVLMLCIGLFGLVVACDGEGENGAENADTDFDCLEDRDGWKQCRDGMVQWCHGDGDNSHFHWGANCKDIDLECYEITKSEAVCLDMSSECTVGELKCEENTAENCIEYEGAGSWAVETCAKACTELDGKAECDEEESNFSPQNACDIMTGSDAKIGRGEVK